MLVRKIFVTQGGQSHLLAFKHDLWKSGVINVKNQYCS
jgi:hypothetical protein